MFFFYAFLLGSVLLSSSGLYYASLEDMTKAKAFTSYRLEVVEDNKTMRTGWIGCPQGMNWDSRAKVCVSPPRSDGACPTGSYFNRLLSMCVSPPKVMRVKVEI
mgnify:CR=1 FL=1